MSDDEEMKNGQTDPEQHSGSPDQVASQQPDDTAPVDDVEPRYDVSGAALGALGHSEEAELYAVAAADPTVSAELAAMEAVAAELARLSPVQLMNRGRSAGIRSRLVARAAGTRMGRPTAKVAPPPRESERPVTKPAAQPSTARAAGSTPPRSSASVPASGASSPARQHNFSHLVPFEPPSRAGLGRIVGALAVAAVVVIAAFGLYNWRVKSLREGPAAAAATRDSSLESQLTSLRASVAQKDSLIASLTGTHTRVIDLVGYNSVDPMARVFWDQRTQMFVMYASHVKQPATGKTYQMWLIARGVASPVSAGTFMPDSSGSAIMAIKHPMEPGTLRRIAVTEEPVGGMPTPTGPIVFTGVGR